MAIDNYINDKVKGDYLQVEKPHRGDITVAHCDGRFCKKKPRSGDILKCHRYAVPITSIRLGYHNVAAMRLFVKPEITC